MTKHTLVSFQLKFFYEQMANNYSHSGTVFNIYWGHKHYLLMEWFTLKGRQEKKEYLNSV